jgi:energy-coupling factor transporter transmembrane protein EcfT
MRGRTELPHLRLWGTSRGVARTLLPEVRVLTAMAALASCLLADPAAWPGLLLLGLTVAVTWLGAMPPLRQLAFVLAVGALMLAPFFLLAPWSDAALPRNALPQVGRVLAPWRIFCTGLGMLAITTTTVSCLTRSDLREALVRLPLPRLLGSIILQIVMQTDLLAREAGRIMLALRARGAHHGLRSSVRAAAGVGRVWLPRLAFKAERVALAMEARAFPTQPLSLDRHRRRARDGFALALACGWTILAVLARLEQVP